MAAAANNQPSSLELLGASYLEVTRRGGLIDFTKKIWGPNLDLQGKYSLKTRDLNKLFDPNLWEESKKADGHRKLTNRVTHVVVEYANHQKMIDPGAAKSALDAVQEHINILGNEIFGFHKNNWKKEPEFKASLKRLKKFQA